MMGKQFDYEKVSIAVNRNQSEEFYKQTYKNKPELRRVVEMVKVKHGKILDIGCGGGFITECLPEFYPNSKIFGCDISKAAISIAKKTSHGKVSYKLMEKKLPYPSGYFDACLSLDVIEHVPDVDLFVKEVRRVLKPGGVFFGAIPCEGQPFTLSWFFRKIGFLQNLTEKHVGHIHPEFTHNYVIKLFESYEFKVIKKSYSERLPVQFKRYFFFMVPKEVLEFFIGPKKVLEYNDSQDSFGTKRTNRSSILSALKTFLYKIRDSLNIVDDLDAEEFRTVSFGAWKINLLVSKNNG